jgi:amidohydrolase
MTASPALPADVADLLVAVRRDIHRDPEIGMALPRTQRRILDALAGLDLEITLGRDLDSVVAVLRGGATVGQPGERRAVILRGDMDALPLTQDLDVDYVSEVDGVMHACGHDLHVAGLIGAVHLLHARRDELAGDVIFMFQPGEEGPGGARVMLDEGLLEASGGPVIAAYALHVASAGQPLGMWFGRPGPQMAAADECIIRVVGAGGHGSQPHLAKDPVPVACEIVLALQLMVTRQFDAMDPLVVTVGRISGGTKDNIIADDATLRSTRRSGPSPRPGARRVAPGRDHSGRRRRHVCPRPDGEIVQDHGYPLTSNDPAEYRVRSRHGHRPLRCTAMDRDEGPGSRLRGHVLRPARGARAYLYVSATPPGVDPATVDDNHSPRATFDDAVVPDMALALAELALRRCARDSTPH